MGVRASSEDYGPDPKNTNRGRAQARAKEARKARRGVEPLERRLMLSTAPVVQSLLQPQDTSTLQPADTAAYTFGGVTFSSDATSIAGLQNFLQGGSATTSFSYTGAFSYLNQDLSGTLGLSVTTAGVSPVSVTITASHVDYTLADASDNTVVSLQEAGGSLTLDNTGATPSLSGSVSGGFTLNVPGVNVAASSLSLDFDASSIKLAGLMTDLTVAGEQFVDPAGAGDANPPSFDFEKNGSDIELRFNGAQADFGPAGSPIVTLSNLAGELNASEAGVYGAIGGDVTLTPGLGVSLGTAHLSLAVNTTDAVTPPLDLGSGTPDTTLPKGSYVAVEATGVGLTVAGETFTDPTTGGSFAFVKSGNDVELSFDGLADSFGGGLLSLSNVHGSLAISDAGVKGAIGAAPTFTTTGISTSAQSLDFNVDTTVSPAQVTVSGQQVNVTVAGQSLTADFSVESGTGNGAEHELKVGIDNLTAFFGTPDGSTGVSITKGHGALLVTPEGVALDAGGAVQLQGINNLQIGGTLDLKVNTTGAEVDAQIDVPGEDTPMELKLAADQPFALEGTADLTLDDSSGNAFVTLHGGFALSKQVQTDANGTTTTLDVGAAGIDAYIGSGSENSGGVGVKISDGTLGLVIIGQTDATTHATTSTYALSAGGAAALVGLDGLDVSGTLSVKANNTGQAIDQPIDVPNPNYDATKPTSPDNEPTISAEVKFDTTDNVLDFGGSVSITVASALTLSGTIDITKDETTGGADVSIPSATIALSSGGQEVVSISGAADFTIDSADGFKLKDSKLTDFSLFGIDAGASPDASPNAILAPNDTSDPSTPGDTEGKATTSTKLGLGPLLLEGPSVGLGNFQFSGGQLQVSVDVGVDTASLRFGSGNTGGTDESSDQGKSGVSVVLTGVHGTFDLSAGFSGGTLSVAPTGAFTFSVGTLTATVPNVVTINAPSVTDTSGTPAIQINYDPADTNLADPLVTVQSADINIPKVGITGTIAPFDDNGTMIPGLVITREGLKLGQATVTKTGPFSLGSLLTFQDLTVGVSDFGVSFSGGVSFNGSLSLSSSGATLFPGKPISASVTPETPGQPALSADFQFSDGQFSDLVFTVGKLNVTLGTYLTLSATGVTVDTGAAGDASKTVAHFDSVGAEVKAGPLDLSGSSSSFDIMGDGSFHADDNFSVSLAIGSATGDSFQWPSWLPVKLDSIGVSWPDVNANPADFVLSLSAEVTSIPGASGLTFSGEVKDIQIDVGKLALGDFPIVGLGSLGVTVSGNLFGGQIDATLLGGILKIGQDNQILPDDAPPDQVKASVFYAGLDGGFSFDGVGGINVKLGLSQYGPLDVFLNATLPEGIVLDPDTGLAINDFTAGIAFDQTLPSLSSASDLDQLDLTGGTTETAAQWLPDLQKQVVNQFVANNGSGPGLSVFSQPMEIEGSAQIFSIYTSEQAFNGQVSVAFSTDGKFAAQGKLNFGQPSPTAPPKLSVSGTLYADLSKVASGAATVLFKANAPDQVQLLTLEGSLKTGFTDDLGNPMTPGTPQTTPLNGIVVTPVTNTSFINVEYEPALGQTLDLKSILAGGQLTLSQNGNDVALGKPVQVGQNIFEYPVVGTLTSGAASVHFIGGTWKDSAGNSGLDSTQAFQVTSLGHAFYIHVDGLALFEGADLATKLGLDPGLLATNPIASISGNATLTIDSQQQLATLDVTGDMHVIGLGDVAQASAHFVLDDSVPTAPVFYGAAAFHMGSAALQPYGITADADAVLEINTSNASQQVTLTGITNSAVQNPITLDPGTAQVIATALISVTVGSGDNQAFSVNGNLLLKVNTDGMDLFASGEVQIGPASKPLFDVNGAAVVVLRDGNEGETPGIAGQIYLNRSGSLPFDVSGISFSGTAFGQFNTTEAPQGFELPASFDSQLPAGFKSLLVPIIDQGQQRYETNITAGPPNADGTSGTPQVYLTTAISGDLVIEDVLTLSGQVQITLGSNEFVIDGVVHGTLVGLGTMTGTVSFNATSDGMWGAAELDLQSQNLPDASLSGHFVLSVNTTGSSQNVPQYTINDQTGAITQSGTTSLDAGKLDLGFGGTVTFGGVFAASGDFEFTLTTTQLTVTANAEMSLGPIGSMHLTGDLQINSAGLVAYGSLGFDAGQTSLGSAYGIGISGTFTFGVNSTLSQVTLDNHPVDPGVKVTVAGSADFLGFASGSGTVTLAALSDQFNLSFDVDFSLASVLNLHADGAATIYTGTDKGIAVDLNVTTSAGLPVANVFTLNFSAGGSVEINTTGTDRTVNGVSIAHDSFTAAMSGNVNLLGVLKLSGGITVTVQDGAWMVQIPQSNQLSLSFFNIANVNAYGFFNSQGAFNIDVNGSLQLGDSAFGVSGGGDIHVYNNPDTTGSLADARGNLNINGTVHMTGTLFGVYVDTGVTFNYDGSDGRIYTDIDVSVGIHIHIHTIFGDINYDGGFSVYTAHFTIGYLVQPPPVQLGQVDGSGALHLYVGSLAANRLFDINQTDESVDLAGSNYDGSSQTITVEMLGQQQTFTGVKSIVGDFGDGSDYVSVGSSVAVPVSFDMGSGNNTAVDSGTGAATLSASGGGYDTLQGGSGPDTITAGTGHYQISGGGNADRITLDPSGTSGSVYAISESNDIAPNYLTVDGTTGSTQYRLDIDPNNGINGGSITVGDPAALDGSNNHTADAIGFGGLQGVTLGATGSGNTFNIRGTVTPTTVNAGSGSATINVGSQAPGTGGTLSGISSPLTLNGSGATTLSLDDSGDAIGRVGQLNATTVTGLGAAAAVNFTGLSDLTALNLALGSGGNTFTVNATPAPLTLSTGAGNDTVNVNADTAPTAINGQGGSDTINVRAASALTTINTGTGSNTTVNLGSAAPNSGGSLGNLSGEVVVHGSGADTLTLDDTGDPAARSATIASDTISGLGMAGGVVYDGLAALKVSLGSGSNTVAVATNGNQTATTLNGGAGNDQFNVTSTGALNTINADGGTNTVNVGSLAPAAGGTLTALQGELIVNGHAPDTLNVDDTGDTTARSATIGSDQITGLGMSQGGIVYEGIGTLNVSLGSGGNTVLVSDAGSNATTTLNAGSGNDTVTLANDSSPNVINAQGGSDTINVRTTGGTTTVNTGSGTNTVNVGSLAPAAGGVVNGIQGGLTVNGNAADTLNVDDTGDGTAQSVAISSNQITGLGMGQVGILFEQLGTLNVSLGSGGNAVGIADAGNSTVTTVNTGAGDDTITLANDSSPNVINTQSGTDQVDILTTGGPTNVNTGAGADTINIGNATGAIQGAVTIVGNGADTLHVSDTADAQPAAGTLTPTTLTGLGMTPAGITYSGLANLNIALGSGGNTLTINDIDPATHTTADGGTSANDTVVANFAADFDGRLDLTSFEHGSVTVTGNFNGTLNDTAPGHLELVNVGGSLTAPAALTAGDINHMTVGGDLAGNVNVAGTLANANVGGNVSGNVNETGTINQFTVGGSVTATATITASNAVPDDANLYSLQVGGDMAGKITVSGTLANATIGGDVSGSVTESGTTDQLQIGGSITRTGTITAGGINDLSVGKNLAGNVNVAGTLASATVGGDVSGNVNETGTIDQFTIDGSLTPTGTITAVNVTPTSGNINTLTVGGNLAGSVRVSGTITTYTVGGDQSGSVIETGTIDQATVDGSLTVTGLIQAVNATPSLGNINSLTIGQDLAGTVIVSGTLGALTIVNGSFAPTANITVGTLNTFNIGPDHLNVGQNLAGNLTVTGTLGSVRVAGGTPGLITAGHVGTIAVYGGYGPDVARVIENGIQRRVELATPANPYPLPDPTVTVTGPYVNVQYLYESGALANPQLTARITNNVSTAKDQYDLSLVTYNDIAKFNLARLDASGVAGVRNVVVEGDLLPAVTPQAAGLFKLSSGAIDSTPAGIRLPLDNLAGVGVRDFAPDGEIQARSIQAVAFGSHAEGWWTEPGANADANDAAELLSWGTAIVQANDTFRVPFADQPQYHVGLFIATDDDGRHFDNASINLAVEGVASPNSTGTGNVIAPSNVARGADTALVTVVPTHDRWGRPEDSVVQSVAIRGDGASIQTGQYITSGITSTGPLGNLTLSSGQGISNITAPSIFGSIVTNGPITGTIQTTGLRTDPITSVLTNVPADLGSVYMVPCWRSWAVTSTVIQSKGGLPGQIISRGNLISAITSDGGISGTIAAQGSLGTFATVAGNTTRQGGVLSNGTFTGELVVLGDAIADVTLHGGLRGGDVAVKGSIFGNLLVDGGLDGGSAIVAGGAIGSASGGTALTVHGRNAGIIAAKAAIRFAGGSAGGAVFNNAATGLNAAAIDALFTNGGQPLTLDVNSGDLQGLNLIVQDLLRLHVASNGTLTGPTA
jgi:hypothetical protein